MPWPTTTATTSRAVDPLSISGNKRKAQIAIPAYGPGILPELWPTLGPDNRTFSAASKIDIQATLERLTEKSPDKKAKGVNYHPLARKVGFLRSLNAPSGLGTYTPRQPGVEMKTYRIKVALKLAKIALRRRPVQPRSCISPLMAS